MAKGCWDPTPKARVHRPVRPLWCILLTASCRLVTAVRRLMLGGMAGSGQESIASTWREGGMSGQALAQLNGRQTACMFSFSVSHPPLTPLTLRPPPAAHTPPPTRPPHLQLLQLADGWRQPRTPAAYQAQRGELGEAEGQREAVWREVCLAGKHNGDGQRGWVQTGGSRHAMPRATGAPAARLPHWHTTPKGGAAAATGVVPPHARLRGKVRPSTQLLPCAHSISSATSLGKSTGASPASNTRSPHLRHGLVSREMLL